MAAAGDTLNHLLDAPRESIRAAVALMDYQMIQVGNDLLGLKMLKGPEILARLNISEFQAHALTDAAQYFLYVRQMMPDLPPKDLLLFMGDSGHFDRVGNIQIGEIKNAIPDALREELATAIDKYKSEKEKQNG